MDTIPAAHRAAVLAIATVAAAAGAAIAQHVAPPSGGGPSRITVSPKPAEIKAKEAKARIAEAFSRGTRLIVQGQESGSEWPYEGVYRVGGKIPVGYRIGGTAICASALVRTPGFEADDDAKSAAMRGMDFIIKGIGEPLMSPDYDGGYDVRGWGYTYGLDFLLLLKTRGLIPDDRKEAAEEAIRFYLAAIQTTEIPQVGGWNYARPPGIDKVAPPSPFMTAPTLLALFEARRQGYEVDHAVVDRALDYLESSRNASGAVVYSGAGDRKRDGVPGAVGRMLATESVLYLAGRGSQAGVRAAIDAFIVHWDWLEQRRAQTGTHVAPYGVAPYYFYYAHYFAAQAVELLPEHERAEYRRRIHDLLFSTREEDGSWNDRVFKRSANYGTAMALMALGMPDRDRPAGWPKQEQAKQGE